MKHNFNSIPQVEKDRILEMHVRKILEEQGTAFRCVVVISNKVRK